MKPILFIMLLIFSLTGSALLPVVRLEIKSMDEATGKGLAGTVVEIRSEGELISSGISGPNGSIESIDVPINQVYKIYFKNSGYVTKVAEIDANCDRPSDLPKSTVVMMQVTLFKEVAGIDLKFLEETPIIIYKFDNKGWMTFDRKYTETMMAKVEGIRKG